MRAPKHRLQELNLAPRWDRRAGRLPWRDSMDADHVLAVKRAGQRPYIVFDHRNVSGGVALFVREGIGKQGAADLGAGLRRNAADQPVVGHIFKKYRGDFISLDLADDARDIAGT